MSVNYIDHVVDQESGIEYEIVDAEAREDISDLKSAMNAIDEKIGDIDSTETSVSTGTQSNGGYKENNDHTVTASNSASYKHCSVNVTEGHTYRITLYNSKSSSYPYMLYLLDNTGHVIDRRIPYEQGDGDRNINYTFTVPSGCTSIAATTFYSSDIELFTASYYDIQSQIDDISDDLTPVKNNIKMLDNYLNSIEDFGWEDGFINSSSGSEGSDSSRKRSKYLLCPPDTVIKYVAETGHSGVYGISFYDASKLLLGGYANNGTNGTEQTVTSPSRTVYCRLSTKNTLLVDTYYKPETRVLPYMDSKILSNTENLKNRSGGYIKFNTNGTKRANAVSINGLIYAEVVDNDYQICVYYLNSQGASTVTSWGTKFLLADYNQPSRIVIKKVVDGSDVVMPVSSANEAVIGMYMAGLATNEYVYQSTDIAYVDGTYGSDTNNGTNPTTAFLTIQKAIDLGFKKILVRAGEYSGGIDLNRKCNVEIRINQEYNDFDVSMANTNPKVVINCNSTLGHGVRAIKCMGCVFDGIEVKNATQSGWYITSSSGMIFNNCIVHDCPTGMGFELINTDADFNSCGCYNIGTYGGSEHRDGFNLHGTGTQNFKNCWANYCEDDGISHHDACEGYVDGGEWHHCGKGGVCTPTHGAKVDISNVYAHHCRFGINAGNDREALAKTFNITNCVCVNNTNKDIYVKNNTANIWNCIYNSIQHEGTGINNVLS